MPSLYMNGRNYTGSGSGEDGGNVYGAFIDTNRVIYDSFVFDGTEQTWTVTEDCMLAGYLDAPDSSHSCYIGIDGVDVFIDYETHNGVLIPAKSGQTVNYLGKSSSVVKAYGLTFGTQNIFTPQIYSTEERCVGVWIDNKPLYQKTIKFTNVSKSGTVSFGIANVEMIRLVNGKASDSIPINYVHGSAPTNNVGGFFDISPSDTGWSFRCGNDAPSTISGDITVLYTKTTDVAGSGSYNTLGVPMVHYSTDEQVVGTYLGNTLYQKTIIFPTPQSIASDAWYTFDSGIANIENISRTEVVDSSGNCIDCVICSKGTGTNLALGNVGRSNITGVEKVTIWYTKSSS